MSVIRRLQAATQPPADRRAVSFQDVWGAGLDDLGGRSTHAGVFVDDDRALRYSAVYACVRLVAETVASLPADSYLRDQRTLVTYRPRPGWIDRPNPEMTRFELVERIMASLLLDGNAYCFVVHDRFGVAAELWPLDPAAVTPVRPTPGGPILYQVHDHDRDVHATLTATDCLHIKAFGHRGLKGLSVISYAAQGIGLGLAAEEFGARFYGQGANPGGIIEVDNPLRDNTVARRMAASFAEAHSGRGRAHLPAVLEGGKWRQLTVNPVDAQALEARQWQVVDIARWFRVPPHKIGEIVNNASQGGGAGLEAQNLMFATDAIRPWLERVEAVCSRPEYLPGEAMIRFDTDSIARGDSVTRAQVHRVYRDSGVLNPNEIRGELGLAPFTGGDDYLQPLNMTPAGTDGARRVSLVRDRTGRITHADIAEVGEDTAGG